MNSPQRCPEDLEAGIGVLGGGDGNSASGDGVSDDHVEASRAKNASSERLRCWTLPALAVNASRRFRYRSDSNRGRQRKEISKMFRAHAEATRAAHLHQGTEDPVVDAVQTLTPTSAAADFGIGLEELVLITRDQNLRTLRQYDGVGGLSLLLKTNLQKGIGGDDDDVLRRRKAFGSNTYHWKKERSFWRFLWEASQDITLVLLMLAAIASLLLGIKTKAISHGWYEEAGIPFAVILVIFVTATSDYKQALQFEKLNEEKNKIHLEVTRNGRRVEVLIFEIVVGDIIPLRIGDQVPADGVLVSGYSLHIDESEITGEIKRVQKDPDIEPFLISGSKVEDGIGTMLVTSVGKNTQWGLLMATALTDSNRETPLQVYLNGIATSIGLISLSLALAVFVIQSCLYFTGHTKNTYGAPMFVPGKTTTDEVIDQVIKSIVLGVTIVVVAVPDGLPLAVTLNLAYTTRKLVAEKALVHKLSACETMGSATTILCHKTGILTLNQMMVVDVCAGGITMQHLDSISQLSPLLTSLIIEGIGHNTNGSVFFPDGESEPEVSGSATERAILDFGIKMGMKSDDVRPKSSILRVSPFNSNKKRRGVALKLSDSLVRVHWKGAAKTILSLCRWFMNMENVVAMDKEKLLYFERVIKEMCTRGLRCAALAYQTYEAGDFPSNGELSSVPEGGLVLLAIIGIKDSCRPGIGDVIQLCHSASIKVCMVTGDDLLTAKAIALECGILTSDVNMSGPIIIEAEAFRSLPVLEREQIAENILVMGRSSPADNLLLLKALRKKGHVVAATGKGIHDVSALREADIGLAMGIGGTAVAKENSDIIILDDNFASIVKVIQWGRSLYTNIQIFAQFRLTVSASALIICVVVPLHSGGFPLNVVQLLLVNLLIDTLGALALASEPPTDQLMQRPPINKREPFFTKMMLSKLVLQVAYQVVALLIINVHGKNILQLKNNDMSHADEVKNTLIFNTFVFCQVFNEFECRNLNHQSNIFTGIFRNHLFLGTIALTVVLQVIVIEFLGIYISTVRLDWKQWLISIGIGLFSQVAGRFPFQVFPYLQN